MASTGIYQQFLQPARSITDYVGEMDAQEMRQQQLQGVRAQNQLAALAMRQKMAADEQATADRNVLQTIASTAKTPDEMIRGLRASGRSALLDRADALEKGLLERKKTDAEIDEKKAKTSREANALIDDKLRRFRTALDYIDTPEAAARWMQAQYTDSDLGGYMSSLGSVDQAIAGIPRDPQGFQQWRNKAALGMEKFLTDQRARDQLAETVRSNQTREAETRRHNTTTEGLTVRGQNMTDARAREKNATDAAAVGKVEWRQDTNGNWIALPKEVSGTGPVTPVTTTAPGKREVQAGQALTIIDQAEKLVDRGTSSYLGAAVDQGARVFGASTKGADAAAQLKALEGALMLAQPRMEGPQSDKDVALYRQMAAQLGDSTVPASQKRAALKEIRALHEKYAGGGAAPMPNRAPAAKPSAPAGKAPSVSNW